MLIRHPNKIIGYTVALLMLSTAQTYGQSWAADFSVGFASYSHPELRSYQEYLLRESVVSATATEKFPPFLTFSVGVSRSWDHGSLGLEIGHGSTGGRVYYEDYSGKLVGDQLVRSTYVAICPSLFVHEKGKLHLAVGVKISAVLHDLDIVNKLTVGDETVSEEAHFRAGTYGFQPHVRVRRDITSRFFVQARAGYEFQTSGETYAPDLNGAFLSDENNEPVHLQGSGLRLSVGAGVAF